MASLGLIIPIYLAVGLLFGLAFIVRGAGVVEPASKDASIAVRLIILPASIALWPYLLMCWIKVGGTS